MTTDGTPIGDLRRWVPYRIDLGPDDPELQWCHLGDRRLTEPFFDESLTAAMARPFNRWVDRRTSMTATATHLAEHPPLAPTAFVFHLGRCGSTLVAQLLAADPASRVLSEPPPFDTVVRSPLRRPTEPDVLRGWLRTTLGALAQPAPGEERLFVKLDCWSVLAAPLLADAFPDVPWLFLHRDPLEVAVSMERLRPFTLIPAALPPELFGMTLDEAVSLPPEVYTARVLGTLLSAFVRLRSRARVLAYPELPDAVGPWLDELGVARSPGVEAAMAIVAGRHAKDPSRPFTDDRADKQAAASPALRAAVDRWARPAWEALCAGP